MKNHESIDERYQRSLKEVIEFIEKFHPEKSLMYKGYSLWWFVYHFVLYYQLNPAENISEKGKNSFQLLFSIAIYPFSFLLIWFTKKLLKKSDKPKFLVVSNPPSLQNIYFPEEERSIKFDVQVGFIEKEIRKKGFNTTIIEVANNKAQLKSINPLRISWGFYKIYTFFRKRHIDKEVKKLLNSFDKFEGSVKDQKLSSTEIHLLATSKHWVDKVIPSAVEVIERAIIALDMEKPSVVIATNEAGTSRPLVIAGKLQGIPTIGIQHGIIHKYHAGYVYPKKINVNELPIPDKMFVFGDFTKRILTRSSVFPQNRVLVTGNSRIDHFIKNKKYYSKKLFLTKLGINDKSKIITVISQPAYKEEIKKYLQNLDKRNDEFLIIKLHPREDIDGYYNFLSSGSWNNNYIVVKHVDIYELLLASDVLVSAVSTVISEAILLNRTVINLKTKKAPELINYSYKNLTFKADTPKVLRELLDSVLSGTLMVTARVRDNFIREHYFKLDGNSTERMVNLITAYIKEKGDGS